MKISSLLITGASSGIGKKLAELLAKPGLHICMMGRNETRLEETKQICEKKGAKVDAHSVNITDSRKVADIATAFDAKCPIDLLIANAGIGTKQSALNDQNEPDLTQIIKTNIMGMHHVIDPLLPAFKKRGRGQIAIMSSLASYRGFSKYYVYSASKAYARIYGQGLRLDLKRFGVSVSTIAPGFVKTPLTDLNEFKMPFLMDTDKASKIIIKGLEKNKSLIAFPLLFYLLTRTLAALPIFIADKIAEKTA